MHLWQLAKVFFRILYISIFQTHVAMFVSILGWGGQQPQPICGSEALLSTAAGWESRFDGLCEAVVCWNELIGALRFALLIVAVTSLRCASQGQTRRGAN